MFVKVFRYQLPKEKREEWEKMVRRADVLYREAEEEDFTLLIHEEGEILNVMELAFYKDSNHFEIIQKKLKMNQEIQDIHKQYTALGVTHFFEETYTTVI